MNIECLYSAVVLLFFSVFESERPEGGVRAGETPLSSEEILSKICRQLSLSFSFCMSTISLTLHLCCLFKISTLLFFWFSLLHLSALPDPDWKTLQLFVQDVVVTFSLCPLWVFREATSSSPQTTERKTYPIVSGVNEWSPWKQQHLIHFT